MGFTARNIPIHFLIRIINDYHVFKNILFIDETGIAGNIDITLDADLTNPQDIIKGLKKSGLNLIEEKRELKVLVIKDPSMNN